MKEREIRLLKKEFDEHHVNLQQVLWRRRYYRYYLLRGT